MTAYLVHVAALISIYAVAGVAVGVLVGWVGMVSVGHAALVGIGAYGAALSALRFHVPFPLSLLAGMAAAVLVGVLVTPPLLRLRGDSFILGTIALQIIVFGVLNNLVGITGGPMGLPGVPPMVPPRWSCAPLANLGLILLALGISLLVAWRLAHSPYGRICVSVRDDAIFAQSLSRVPAYYRSRTFWLSAAIAGLAGGLYAHFATFIDPSSFTLDEALFLFAIVAVGGADSVWGPVIGAAILLSIPEALRFIGLPPGVVGNVRQVIYGVFLVLFMLLRPQGVVGRWVIGESEQ